MGLTPVTMSAGNATKLPPPATEFSAPPSNAATKSRHAFRITRYSLLIRNTYRITGSEQKSEETADQAAIDLQSGAGDVAGLFAAQIGDSVPHVSCLAHAAHRHA